MPDATQPAAATPAASTSAATATAAQPAAVQPVATPGDSLGPQLTDAKARIIQLLGEQDTLAAALEKSKAETFEQKEEVARLQGLLTKLAKSQLPELGEGAYELGEGATILAASDVNAEPARVHALIGDVLAVGLKAGAFAKVKEKVAGKARVFAIDKATFEELQSLKLLRA